ncbi:zinc-regulated TonB-dependent outer membrane receptor [Oleiphilus messinensis]|uniref:Zinc-regulated TonB-dependent outer membrane receptor n=1 Tax=Oleiphilus messinensis TaxID=141451 RepID=A0A1Y0IFJ9_9GAMM|nr:porin [Oleiphilus messinensis]ARU59261.1 zinc-regulated TonB-dependent outer membrane receptor [Oleiphilus messinensis]
MIFQRNAPRTVRVARTTLIGAVSVLICVGELSATEFNPNISVVLDGRYQQNEGALGHSESGFAVGHNELTLSAPVDDLFVGRLTTVLEDHEGETEVNLEEAFVQTVGLSYNLTARGGRFLSQFGYLNSRHTHSDHFSSRPAVYRALFGSHYYDDGVQLNLLLPTPLYWQVGVEALNGDRLSEGNEDVGVFTARSEWGGDLSVGSSWQLGVSYLHNRQTAVPDEAGADHSGHDHTDQAHGDHDHAGHSHSIAYTGKHTYGVDLVWKWSPEGNVRQQQVVISGEYIRATDPNEYASDDDIHEGWYASAVYRFTPQWSIGARYGELDVSQPHGDHFHDQALEEADFMVAYQHSHFSTLRLQFSHQDGEGFENTDDTLVLQYVMSFGDHGAHEF